MRPDVLVESLLICYDYVGQVSQQTNPNQCLYVLISQSSCVSGTVTMKQCQQNLGFSVFQYEMSIDFPAHCLEAIKVRCYFSSL